MAIYVGDVTKGVPCNRINELVDAHICFDCGQCVSISVDNCGLLTLECKYDEEGCI
jgi:hypothetical protein